MSCPRCGHALPVGFPGATVTCSCGQSVELAVPPPAPSARAPEHRTSGPYRDARATVTVAPELTIACPYCSNACPALVRICPHCDVRLESVRCARCYSLQTPGAFACARCGEPMELEPLLDPTDGPCPRCRTPLEATSPALDARTHECPRCGGIFVAREVLAELLCRAEVSGALAPPHGAARTTNVLDEVKYLPCPLCHASMNRANFGRVSGVIVDVCAPHGTWFDAGELTRVIAFASSGGLEKSRARERQDKKDQARLREAEHARMEIPRAGEDAERRLLAWREFLAVVLRW